MDLPGQSRAYAEEETAIAMSEHVEIEEQEDEEEERFAEEAAVEENSFSGLQDKYMSMLQNIAEEMGFNTKAGIEMMLSSNQDDGDLTQRFS